MKPLTYPRISEIALCRRGRCRFCRKSRSDTAIVVQVNCFRGDDAVFPVHAACIEGKKVRELLQILVETGTSRKGKACSEERTRFMSTSALTVTVSQRDMTEVTQAAIRQILEAIFKAPYNTEYPHRGGPGYRLLNERVEQWIETFDFMPLIENLSDDIIEATLREVITKAIQARAGKVLSRMIAEGELDARIATIVEQKIAERSNS